MTSQYFLLVTCHELSDCLAKEAKRLNLVESLFECFVQLFVNVLVIYAG